MFKIRTLQIRTRAAAKTVCGLILPLILLLPATPAAADVLSIPDENPAMEATPAPELPLRGSTMAAVRARFGEPKSISGPVGGDHPQRPPITRWEYDSFSVFFEHDHVVHSVIPDKPKPIYHKEELNSGY